MKKLVFTMISIISFSTGFGADEDCITTPAVLNYEATNLNDLNEEQSTINAKLTTKYTDKELAQGHNLSDDNIIELCERIAWDQGDHDGSRNKMSKEERELVYSYSGLAGFYTFLDAMLDHKNYPAFKGARNENPGLPKNFGSIWDINKAYANIKCDLGSNGKGTLFKLILQHQTSSAEEFIIGHGLDLNSPKGSTFLDSLCSSTASFGGEYHCKFSIAKTKDGKFKNKNIKKETMELMIKLRNGFNKKDLDYENNFELPAFKPYENDKNRGYLSCELSVPTCKCEIKNEIFFCKKF